MAIHHAPTFLKSAMFRDPFCHGSIITPEDVLRMEERFPALFDKPIPATAEADKQLLVPVPELVNNVPTENRMNSLSVAPATTSRPINRQQAVKKRVNVKPKPSVNATAKMLGPSQYHQNCLASNQTKPVQKKVDVLPRPRKAPTERRLVEIPKKMSETKIVPRFSLQKLREALQQMCENKLVSNKMAQSPYTEDLVKKFLGERSEHIRKKQSAQRNLARPQVSLKDTEHQRKVIQGPRFKTGPGFIRSFPAAHSRSRSKTRSRSENHSGYSKSRSLEESRCSSVSRVASALEESRNSSVSRKESPLKESRSPSVHDKASTKESRSSSVSRKERTREESTSPSPLNTTSTRKESKNYSRSASCKASSRERESDTKHLRWRDEIIDEVDCDDQVEPYQEEIWVRCRYFDPNSQNCKKEPGTQSTDPSSESDVSVDEPRKGQITQSYSINDTVTSPRCSSKENLWSNKGTRFHIRSSTNVQTMQQQPLLQSPKVKVQSESRFEELRAARAVTKRSEMLRVLRKQENADDFDKIIKRKHSAKIITREEKQQVVTQTKRRLEKIAHELVYLEILHQLNELKDTKENPKISTPDSSTNSSKHSLELSKKIQSLSLLSPKSSQLLPPHSPKSSHSPPLKSPKTGTSSKSEHKKTLSRQLSPSIANEGDKPTPTNSAMKTSELKSPPSPVKSNAIKTPSVIDGTLFTPKLSPQVEALIASRASKQKIKRSTQHSMDTDCSEMSEFAVTDVSKQSPPVVKTDAEEVSKSESSKVGSPHSSKSSPKSKVSSESKDADVQNDTEEQASEPINNPLISSRLDESFHQTLSDRASNSKSDQNERFSQNLISGPNTEKSEQTSNKDSATNLNDDQPETQYASNSKKSNDQSIDPSQPTPNGESLHESKNSGSHSQEMVPSEKSAEQDKSPPSNNSSSPHESVYENDFIPENSQESPISNVADKSLADSQSINESLLNTSENTTIDKISEGEFLAGAYLSPGELRGNKRHRQTSRRRESGEFESSIASGIQQLSLVYSTVTSSITSTSGTLKTNRTGIS